MQTSLSLGVGSECVWDTLPCRPAPSSGSLWRAPCSCPPVRQFVEHCAGVKLSCCAPGLACSAPHQSWHRPLLCSSACAYLVAAPRRCRRSDALPREPTAAAATSACRRRRAVRVAAARASAAHALSPAAGMPRNLPICQSAPGSIGSLCVLLPGPPNPMSQLDISRAVFVF